MCVCECACICLFVWSGLYERQRQRDGLSSLLLLATHKLFMCTYVCVCIGKFKYDTYERIYLHTYVNRWVCLLQVDG